MKVALIQMNSQPDRVHNLRRALELMSDAVAAHRPDLIVLPEHFDWSGGTPAQKLEAADSVPGGQAYTMLSRFAAEHRVWIHAGSILEKIPDSGKIYNTTVVFNETGGEVGRYRKLHLFDITTPAGRSYGESETVAPGSGVFVYDYMGFRIGCVICYDLRFSNLFWQLAHLGADVLVLPAAFTVETGRDHWEVLCRSRAIEFQSYFLACGQWGPYRAAGGETRECFGDTLVCDPWGQIIARANDGEAIVVAELDPERVQKVRALIPMQAHRKPLARCGTCRADGPVHQDI
ncbi:carbon-nitrogen hydrolase family protein [Pelagibacterium sp. H642]|uniref:carbon-nitrogen hydrolase family protein n=1 Tax=Pelagibacterium sp. H642 TaxID=1881069 RepID=UPI00281583D4|nr:carbon-nitrogen hydrolase family protein [Pelagibacterium sp. H642]WMT92574.1 carbon-nitrogen hydrolase family protein [Pelagibacterium sp. H642]